MENMEREKVAGNAKSGNEGKGNGKLHVDVDVVMLLFRVAGENGEKKGKQMGKKDLFSHQREEVCKLVSAIPTPPSPTSLSTLNELPP